MSTATTTPDPRPGYYVGKAVSFDYEGKRLIGRVEAQTFTGYSERGQIPDWTIKVRGKTGAVLSVSLVESRASFPAT